MRTGVAFGTAREGLADVLTSFLAQSGRTPFVWGSCDCFLFAADWIECVTGIDPAVNFRGQYDSERRARHLMREHGGPVAFAGKLLAAAGCIPTDAPTRGDVALVRIVLRQCGKRLIVVPVGAICLRPSLWAVKTFGASITFGNFPVAKAWAVPDG